MKTLKLFFAYFVFMLVFFALGSSFKDKTLTEVFFSTDGITTVLEFALFSFVLAKNSVLSSEVTDLKLKAIEDDSIIDDLNFKNDFNEARVEKHKEALEQMTKLLLETESERDRLKSELEGLTKTGK